MKVIFQFYKISFRHQVTNQGSQQGINRRRLYFNLKEFHSDINPLTSNLKIVLLIARREDRVFLLPQSQIRIPHRFTLDLLGGKNLNDSFELYDFLSNRIYSEFCTKSIYEANRSRFTSILIWTKSSEAGSNRSQITKIFRSGKLPKPVYKHPTLDCILPKQANELGHLDSSHEDTI